MTERHPKVHYAVIHPMERGRVLYWTVTPKGIMSPWPSGNLNSFFDPERTLYKQLLSDALGDSFTNRRKAASEAWRTRQHDWVVDCGVLIEEDPEKAAKRFAEFTIRCFSCGRSLTDAKSKASGIGPDCRQEFSKNVIEHLFLPAVARAHAEHLEEKS